MTLRGLPVGWLASGDGPPGYGAQSRPLTTAMLNLVVGAPWACADVRVELVGGKQRRLLEVSSGGEAAIEAIDLLGGGWL